MNSSITLCMQNHSFGVLFVWYHGTLHLCFCVLVFERIPMIHAINWRLCSRICLFWLVHVCVGLACQFSYGSFKCNCWTICSREVIPYVLTENPLQWLVLFTVILILQVISRKFLIWTWVICIGFLLPLCRGSVFHL